MFASILSCHNRSPYFVQLTPSQTRIHFRNEVRENDTLNILTYPYLFNGAGVAAGDINNDGLDDLFFIGNRHGSSRLYLNKGNFQFEDVSNLAGITGQSDWCTGVALADVDADGWLDIYVSAVSIDGFFKSRNALYINNHDGTFTEAAQRFGLDFEGHTTQSTFFDYDRDGDLDCFLLNHAVRYSDDFADVSARKKTDAKSGNKLLQNNNGHFEDITQKAGIYSAGNGYGLGIAIGDLNNDGWPDVYVSNDFKESDFCYINNGNGTFTESAEALFNHVSRFSMGNDMADYNNDGWLDLITLDMLSKDEKVLKASVADDDIEIYNYKQHFGFHYQFSKNCLQQNNGGKFFSDVGLQAGVAATDWSWAPLFADFDNDGRKDLYISNGFKYRVNDLDFNAFVQNTAQQSGTANFLKNQYGAVKYMPAGDVADCFFLNVETGFTDASVAAGFTKPTLSNGAAYSDLDNDGDLDLVVNRINALPGIYKNEMPQKNYLALSLRGEGRNTFGIGSSVYVYAQGQMQRYTQMPQRGFMSSVSPVLHVGLGNAKTIDSLVIVWPGGLQQRVQNIAANQTLTLHEKVEAFSGSDQRAIDYFSTYWTDATASKGLHFTHNEDGFNDLNVQPFLPHSLATQGPKITTGDVNGDGLEDIYVCGAKGQSGALFLQEPNENFKPSMQPAFVQDSMCEDTDALLFDADNDGDNDLYVCSGGNEWYGRQALLQDRLYINNGKGVFARTVLPDLYENKSCVRACDFDRDGDLDLFVGGRANARLYGYMPASVLLTNDGRGHFTEATQQHAVALSNVGMVTGAAWSDVDGDGWHDLVVVGEWMPVTVFKNKQGVLKKLESPALKNTEGWWNCIYKTDLDGDGSDDFLLGNWGLNSKLKANKENPLTMYVADWDKNGETDPVLAVHNGADYYTFLGKSDLEKRLPFLKKRFLKYGDMAGKTVTDVFTNSALQNAQTLKACTLQSSVLWNRSSILTLKPLPLFLQAAPIFSFAAVNTTSGKDLVAVGNFYEVSPYEGRYDAMLPTVFNFFKAACRFKAYLPQNGAIRDVKPIVIGNNQGLLLARNNDRITLLKQIP